MPYSRIVCRSWHEFKAEVLPGLFDGGPISRDTFLFRGQGSTEWPLLPSFDRWYTGKPGNKARAAERLLELFQKEAEGVPVERDIWSDRIRRLALAQHHGVPTRLLDWSESPYIAAFFAFSYLARGASATKSVAIWCLDRRETDVWSPELGVEIVSAPSYGNDRLRNQIGWFTLLKTPYNTLEEHVNHFPEATKALRQFHIPAKEVQNAI